MTDYSQNVLISRLNQYLKSTSSSLALNHGYCHGLTLLWLFKIANGEEDWFYQTINKIITLQATNEQDKDIEKFIAHIEWLQQPNEYVTKVNQLDIDKVLELPKQFSYAYLFNLNQLKETLTHTVQKNALVCLSGLDHTVGIFKKGDNEYHYFDANYIEGNVRILHSLQDLSNHIITSLYSNTPTDRYPIEINIVAAENNHHTNRYLINGFPITDKLFDVPGLKHATNLYLACENGDEAEVKYLLRLGANPNQAGYRGNTPLSVAVEGGYQLVVAALLENGADPLLKMCYHQTPLHDALLQKNWQSVVMMLCHLQDAKRISFNDRTALLNHRKEIMQQITQHLPNLSDEQQTHLMGIANKMFASSTSSTFFKAAPTRIVLHRSPSNYNVYSSS